MVSTDQILRGEREVKRKVSVFMFKMVHALSFIVTLINTKVSGIQRIRL